MKQELEDKLCKEFPTLYRDYKGNPTQTCMAWGLDVGDGWFNIIYNLSLCIQNTLENADNNAIYQYKTKAKLPYDTKLPLSILEDLHVGKRAVVAEQVKEKYGSLRFYFLTENLSEQDDAHIHGLVDMAECMSSTTCELCGDKGECSGNGWLSVRCISCKNEEQKGKTKLNLKWKISSLFRWK